MTQLIANGMWRDHPGHRENKSIRKPYIEHTTLVYDDKDALRPPRQLPRSREPHPYVLVYMVLTRMAAKTRLRGKKGSSYGIFAKRFRRQGRLPGLPLRATSPRASCSEGNIVTCQRRKQRPRPHTLPLPDSVADLGQASMLACRDRANFARGWDRIVQGLGQLRSCVNAGPR